MKSLLFLSLIVAPLAALAAPITVRVVDEAGAPVKGATVQINRSGEVKLRFAVETTDAQGVAKYELDASKFDANFFGHAAAWKAGSALSGGSLLKLNDGTLTLTLSAAASVSGRIEDANGPVEGALITLDNAQGKGHYLWLGANSPLAQKLSARSDAKGQFTLKGVPADAQLKLRVMGEGYATQNVRTQSGGEISVQLKPGATLRGQALGADGAPLSGLEVVAVSQRDKYGENFIEATTDAAGNYTISGLEGSNYNVMFRPASEAEFVVAARENALAVAGAERELETARAVPGVLVRGRVIDATSKAGIPNLSVAVFGPAQPASSGPIQAVATDKDGNFSARVAPGANTVSVLYAPREWENANRKLEIDVRADAAAPEAIIELTPAIALRGRIVNEAGNGVKTRLSIKKEYREWPLEIDENGEFTDYPDFKGEVTVGRSMFAEEEKETDGKAPILWEVVQPQTFVLPSKEPLQIVVRRAQVGAITGRAEDENGAPIAGVKLNVQVANGEGIGSTSRWESVNSNAQGVFNFPNVRTDQTVKLRGVEATGYDLQSGGEISRKGDDWKVQTVKMRARKNQLAGRITLADGAPAANAMIFAAGSETRADANGAYILKVLPAGNVDVFVYANRQFGFRSAQTSAQTALPGDAATPTDFKLFAQTLQPTDRELAGEMIARARVLAAQTNSSDVERLKLREADAVASLEALVATPPRKSDELVKRIYSSAGNPNVSTDLLLRAVRAVSDPNWRLYAATMLFAKRPDWPDDEATRELAASLMRDADGIAADKAPNKWLGAVDLVSIAPLIEKFEGEAAGRAAMARGIEFTKTQYPQPGNGNTDGYLSMLAAGADSIAATSPQLFAQLMEAIEPTSPAYSRALQEGITAISKARGLEAAAPFLRQLSEAPAMREDENSSRVVASSMMPRATRQAIEAGGAKDPALALQLARGLGKDNNIEDESARALAEAAFFQPPAKSASLWKEALPQLDADRAAQIAARVAKTQPVVGAELLELARQQLETADEVNLWGNSIVAGFAFYEAQLDAARARYRLEKAWQKAQGKTDDFRTKPDLIRAMSAIDGERSFEWASLLPADEKNDERIRALSQAARYIEASEKSRARVDFEKWKRDSTVFED